VSVRIALKCRKNILSVACCSRVENKRVPCIAMATGLQRLQKISANADWPGQVWKEGDGHLVAAGSGSSD
jgi:hypothetical protein